MRFSLIQKLFFFTSATMAALLTVTFFLLERSQSRQWEEHLRSQSISFSQFATPEVLKRFRGTFPLREGGALPEVYEMLAANRDLIKFSLLSPGSRVLFQSQSFNGFSQIDLAGESHADLADRLQSGRTTVRTWKVSEGRRIFDVLTPAFGPTGEHIISVRYLISYDSLDARLQEMRQQFLRIGLISIVCSLGLVALVSRRITRPLKELTEGARAVARGDLETRIDSRRGDEIGTLAEAFNDMARSLAFSQDELREKNSELVRANEALRGMQEQMIRAERLAAIGQMAAGISHEIDNPVGIILGYAELLLEDMEEGDPRREDVAAIIEECKRCRRITGGLLGFARSAPSRRETIFLGDLVEGTLASLRPQKLFRGVELSFIPYPEPLAVSADPDQLRQVFINLFLNAGQALGGKGRLAVTLGREGGRATVRVADSGPGVPPQLREKIFDPFFTTKSRGEGTGLGLSVCRKLVQDHGGRLWAEESPSGGALFVLELPVEIPEKNFDKVPDDSLG